MKKEIEKQAVDLPTVLKYMGGGALLGGGTAATAALVRLLLNLNEEKNRESDTSLDDSTIYINLKGTGKKQKKVKKASRSWQEKHEESVTKNIIPKLLAMLEEYGGVNMADGTASIEQLQNELGEGYSVGPSDQMEGYILIKALLDQQAEGQKAASFPMLEKKAVNSDTAALSYLGMALAAYLGYTGVNKVFNRVRERRLQKELDLAQQVYIDRMAPPPDPMLGKEASVKSAISRPTFAMTVAKALPLLIALGTAVAAYRVLDKHSPLPKKTGTKPKRIVLRSQGSRKESPVPDDIAADDVEHLLRTTMAKESRANDNGLHDLVSYVGNGGFDSFKSNFKKFGFDTALNMIKGARFDNKSALDKNIAISLVSRDEVLKPSVAVLAASEFYDMSPGIMKSAQALSGEMQEALLKAARELLNNSSAEIYAPVMKELKNQIGNQAFDKVMAKEAFVGDVSTMLALKNLFSGKSDEQGGQEENVQNSGKLQVPTSKSSDDKEYNDKKTDQKKVYLQIQDDEAKKFWTKNKDIIDEALALS